MPKGTKETEQPEALISVLILEDNPAVGARFTKIVEDWPKGVPVKHCLNLEDALDIIRSIKVDLLIADIHLPDGSGIDAIRLLRELQPKANAVVISALSGRELVIDALKAGADGYILKDDPNIEVVSALESIVAGHSPISATIARQLIETIFDGEEDPHSAGDEESNPTPLAKDKTPKGHLTPRERQVLNAIAKGFSYKEIANLLSISEQTVPVHIRNIYRKLEVKSRSEAAYEGRLMGLIDE
jgi:DNA-binding NarL/FixJ family response regulator